MEIGQLFLGLVLSAMVALGGYLLGVLSLSGGGGAIVLGTLAFGLGSWTWGLPLAGLFLSGSLLTHYRQKGKGGVSAYFAKDGPRDLGQTLANGGVGGFFAVLYILHSHPLLFYGFLGALTASAADTWATELGLLSSNWPRLLTTGAKVPPGTSGAISSWGLVGALLGSLFIGMTTFPGLRIERGSLSWYRALSLLSISMVSGLVGTFLDSLLGATLQGVYWCPRCRHETERKVHLCGQATQPARGYPWFNNDLVNLAGSLMGGLSGVASGAVFPDF
ncbi:MAG: DUF92 domain-containing protein [candidate division NC10 bacterium]|nr:DUF92 domain-containing protein [candidate division NC10 bacterium]